MGSWPKNRRAGRPSGLAGPPPGTAAQQLMVGVAEPPKRLGPGALIFGSRQL